MGDKAPGGHRGTEEDRERPGRGERMLGMLRRCVGGYIIGRGRLAMSCRDAS